MKIFKFRRLVQRKLLLLPLLSSDCNSAATSRPPFRRFFSPPELHPAFLVSYLATCAGCLQHKRIFKCHRDYFFPLGLKPPRIIAGGRDERRAIVPFFLLVMPSRGNCLLSFEITVLSPLPPTSSLPPHLMINFTESVRPLIPLGKNQVPRRVPLLASSFDENAQSRREL